MPTSSKIRSVSRSDIPDATSAQTGELALSHTVPQSCPLTLQPPTAELLCFHFATISTLTSTVLGTQNIFGQCIELFPSGRSVEHDSRRNSLNKALGPETPRTCRDPLLCDSPFLPHLFEPGPSFHIWVTHSILPGRWRSAGLQRGHVWPNLVETNREQTEHRFKACSSKYA